VGLASNSLRSVLRLSTVCDIFFSPLFFNNTRSLERPASFFLSDLLYTMGQGWEMGLGNGMEWEITNQLDINQALLLLLPYYVFTLLSSLRSLFC
jgi:hypothetical protein